MGGDNDHSLTRLTTPIGVARRRPWHAVKTVGDMAVALLPERVRREFRIGRRDEIAGRLTKRHAIRPIRNAPLAETVLSVESSQ
jgi:hypothetical protein